MYAEERTLAQLEALQEQEKRSNKSLGLRVQHRPTQILIWAAAALPSFCIGSTAEPHASPIASRKKKLYTERASGKEY